LVNETRCCTACANSCLVDAVARNGCYTTAEQSESAKQATRAILRSANQHTCNNSAAVARLLGSGRSTAAKKFRKCNDHLHQPCPSKPPLGQYDPKTPPNNSNSNNTITSNILFWFGKCRCATSGGIEKLLQRVQMRVRRRAIGHFDNNTSQAPDIHLGTIREWLAQQQLRC
jgi:hypothetical protein